MLLILLTAIGWVQERSVGERLFEHKALPVTIEVTRGEASLPVTRVPRLEVGDRVRLAVDLKRPEFASESSRERSRLTDWSIGFFLTTEDGSLIYDEWDKDFGRIDLYEGQSELTFEVHHPRQQFPVFFFVRTRTLESWDYVRETRERKQTNFIDHFGRYSDAVDDYENLQAFLRSLETEGPRGESLNERLVDGFEELGFTVDTQMRLDEPGTVAKLLAELDRNFLRDGNTIKAEIAGKALGQLIAESNLGLVGLAAQLGVLIFEVSDYRETYHWSSARLDSEALGGYLVMSSERIRYGEQEQAQDGQVRDNVRSILVCTPLPIETPQKPALEWLSPQADQLVPGSGPTELELLVTGSRLQAGTQPSLVGRFLRPECQVVVNGQESGVTASLTPRGELQLANLESLWHNDQTRCLVKVFGFWGFEPFPIVEFQALRSAPEITFFRAPYILNRGRRYRVEVESGNPFAFTQATFRGQVLKPEAALAPDQRQKRFSLRLDLSQLDPGPASLELFAGDHRSRATRIAQRSFQIVPEVGYQVVLPQGSRRCELTSANDPNLDRALAQVKAIEIGSVVFQREEKSRVFRAPNPPSPGQLEESNYQARLTFDSPTKEPVEGVFVRYERPPQEVGFVLYPSPPEPAPHQIELDSPSTKLLASGKPVEFRVMAPSAWRGQVEVDLCLRNELFPERCTRYRTEPKPDQQLLKIKQEILFGEFTPQRSGRLVCRLRTGLRDSRLPLRFSLDTDWRVVDLPRIESVERTGDWCVLRGQDLDVLIARVFFSGDPGVDPVGSRLVRAQDGSYRALLKRFNENDFWIELRDLEGEPRRLRVRPNRAHPSAASSEA